MSERGKVDADSIRKFVYKTVGTWKALEMREHPATIVERTLKSLSITVEEYEGLTDYFIMLTAFLAGKMDFEKRPPLFDSSLWPTPWFSDCVKITPSFGVRLFWSPPKHEEKNKASNYLSWYSIHKNILDIMSQGDEDPLDQYLKELSTRLQFSWTPICLKREHDGECTIKNVPCPHSSVFECEIVRENSKKLESVLSFLIEQKY